MRSYRAYHRKNPKRRQDGSRRFEVAYIDPDGRVRTKGGFIRRRGRGADSAQQWIDDYLVAAQGGRAGVQAYLDRELRGIVPADTPDLSYGEFLDLYLAQNAPDLAEGLAAATWDYYRRAGERHIKPAVGDLPLAQFVAAGPTLELIRRMRDTTQTLYQLPGAKPKPGGYSEETVKKVKAVLSASLEWGVQQQLLAANGAKTVSRPRRRSTRGKSRRQARRRDPAWALSPDAVAAVLEEMRRHERGRPGRALRDYTIGVLQYCTGARNQDLFGLRWTDVHPSYISFEHALTFGGRANSRGLLLTGKVGHSERRTPISDILSHALADWRRETMRLDLTPTQTRWVIPGQHPDGHFSSSQARKWPRDCFQAAARRLAEREPQRWAFLARVTQYSLRRGHISVRLRRGEDAAKIATECATSVDMLLRHYYSDVQDGHDGAGDRRPLEHQLAEALRRLDSETGSELRFRVA